jgi:hypothetical protein
MVIQPVKRFSNFSLETGGYDSQIAVARPRPHKLCYETCILILSHRELLLNDENGKQLAESITFTHAIGEGTIYFSY